nr:zinc finger, CCHC-type [Tanacetum cinerariifolium]
MQVCKDRCWFKTYESLNDGSIFHMGNELTALVHGRGCVDLRDAIFDENRFSLVPRPSQRSLVKGTKDSGGLVVPEKDDPQTFDEAIKSQDVAFWKEAINDEMDSIIGNNTWVLADLPPGCKPLGWKWIFKIKLKVDGTVSRQGWSFSALNKVRDRLLCQIIHPMDVKTTFLNGKLEEEVYMNQPQGFIMPANENMVFKLIKSLYGLKQAPKQWHQKFDKVVLSNGYLLNQTDKCVYRKFDKSSKGVIICLYVDNMPIFGTDQVHVDLTKEFLSSRFSMKDMREDDVILVTTLMDTSEKLMPNNGQAVSQLKYSRVIGCLMFVMTCIRPDFTFAMGKLMLEGYTDASWISNTKDNLSTSGWVFLLGGGVISWASKKQTCITGSIMESKFMALAAVGKEAKWLKNFLLEIPLWVKPITPIFVRCDSAATLAKAYSQMYNGKSKHLVPLDLSKDTIPYNRLRSSRSIQLGTTCGIRANVIKNGNKVLKRTVGISEETYEPTSAEEKLDRRNEIKAKGTLLMALPNKDKLKFHSYQDAKLLMKAIKKRILTHDSNLQNMAFVSSNSPCSTNEVDTTASGVSTTHTQGTTINSTSVDSLSDDVICAFLTSQLNSPHLAKEDLEQIDPDDLKEMDLHWEMAMLTIRARRTSKNQDNRGREYGRKTVPVETHTENALITQDRIRGYDWSYQAEEEIPSNYAFMALTSSGISSSSDSEVDSCSKSCMKAYANIKEQYDSLTLDYKKSQYNLLSYKADGQVSDKSKAGIGYKGITPDSFVNSSEILEKQENRSNKGYHAVPLPLTENYMPLKCDLRFIDKHFESVSLDVISNITPSDVKTVKTIDVNNKGVFSTEEPKPVMKNNFSKINTAGASVTTAARPVNTAGSKSHVTHPRPKSKAFQRGNSKDTRPNNKFSANKNSIFNKKVNIVRVNDSTTRDRAVVSGNMRRDVNVVKAPTCWVWKAKHSSASTTFKKYSYIDARSRSKHMTGNKCYLTDFEAYNGGFVSFGDGKGGLGTYETVHKERSDIMERVATTTSSLEAERKPRKEAETSHDESEDEDHVPTPYSNPLPSGEDSFILNELMVFCTSLQEQDGLGAQEDASKHRRMIEEIDQNGKIALDDETQGRTNDDQMFRVDDLAGEEVVMDSAAEPVTTVKDSESIKPKVVVQEQEMSTTIPAAATTVTTTVPTSKAKGIVYHEQNKSQIPTVSSSKDKGKAKMIEPIVPIKKKDQMRIDEEYARKLEAEEQEASRLSRAQQDEEANNS